ncbi:MAG: PEP-CTERM sorting domain-containing protein [Pirellulales bacterium]
MNSGTLSITGLGGIVIGPGGQLTTLSLSSGQTLNVTHTTTVVTGGALTVTNGDFSSSILKIDGGTVDAPNLRNVPDLQVDAGVLTLSGNSSSVRVSGNNPGTINVTGDLSLGDGSKFDGYDHQGALSVGPHQVTLQSARFANLGTIATLNGGILNAANGVTLGIGDNLVGSGTVSAPIVAGFGSTISASGSLMLGDMTAVNGFGTAGLISVGSHTVTLQDSNDAVLDSLALVSLGDNAGSPGTLNAANGLTLDFGGNITGFGTVDTPNTSVKPLINNGHITGNSVAERVTLTGYVKGVGTCDFCVITGTDAPGFSTAVVNRGTVSYNGTLEIEIGGTTPGSGYDQLKHILGSGVADLGGTLDVLLIDGFVPSAENTFNILTAAGGIQGTFATESLPSLTGDLFWDVIYETNQVLLEVVTPYAADFDGNGMVDGTDLGVLLGNWGQDVTMKEGELNDTVPVNGLDLGLLLGDWTGTLPLNVTSVPAPSSVLLLAVGAAGLVPWRRRECR